MTALLIRNGWIFTNNAVKTVIDGGDILVVDDEIVAVGKDLGQQAATCRDLRIIDAGSRLVLPGFVDAHMHSNEGFEMGRYDNLPLEIWLSEVYPPFHVSTLTARDKYLRAMMVGIMSVRSGVTTLQDDVINLGFTPDMVDATACAYRDLGLRGWLTASMWDENYCDSLPFLRKTMPAELVAALDALPLPGQSEQIALFKELHGTWHDKHNMRIILGPCGPQRCSRSLLEEVGELSAAMDLPIHCHVLETRTQAVTGQEKYGRTLVRYLEETGCLTHRLTMNHAIWLTDADIELMGGSRVSITHNPLANLKLGSGVAPVRKLLNAGVNVALGCDGVASADTADMFEAFKAAAMIHKIGTHAYHEWISAHDVMEMATLAGARSGLMDQQVGSIEAGKQADIILLDRKAWGFIPLHDPIRQIAFSASSDSVRTSIIAGRIVMEERKLTFVDEEGLRAEISDAAERFLRAECPAMSRHAASVRPWLDDMHATATARDVGISLSPRRMPPHQSPREGTGRPT